MYSPRMLQRARILSPKLSVLGTRLFSTKQMASIADASFDTSYEGKVAKLNQTLKLRNFSSEIDAQEMVKELHRLLDMPSFSFNSKR